LKGDLEGLELFEKAIELDPCNPEIFYRQGLALFEYGSEEGREKALLLAGKKFKTATALFPEYFDAWLAWGNALSLLGMTYREHHYFLEAEEKLKRSVALAEGRSTDLLAELFWDYGIVWSRIAHHSGEAIDWQYALDAFLKAHRYQESLPAEFWHDYGIASLEMGERINDIRLTVKAINCFKHAVSLSIPYYEGWKWLAHALKLLYLHTHDEDHFAQASECFATAAHLRPTEVSLSLEWAAFLLASARQNRDLKRLRLSLEKCKQVHAAAPKQPLILATWAEALALFGEMTDRIDFIHEAQNKIAEATELMDEESPQIWFSFGMCLNSCAHYFSDLDYHYQAIEKFQYGLSMDRTRDDLWHAIAETYALIGDHEGDIDAYEKAVRFYAKALDLKPLTLYLVHHAIALSRLGEMKRDENLITEAVAKFDQALQIQKNALYIHPDWMFHYGEALDLLGDFHDDESYYLRSIEILSHVLMIDPDFPGIHHRLGLAFSHLGELLHEADHFYRSVHHFRIALKQAEESDLVYLDWGVAIINLSQHLHSTEEIYTLYHEAEAKLTQAAKLGNQQAFYHLSCLYSLLGEYEKAMHFIHKAYACHTLPPIDEVLDDEWLDGLRSTSDFQTFLTHIEKE
jgi:tetratricopeptide (TPR) repeat protein